MRSTTVLLLFAFLALTTAITISNQNGKVSDSSFTAQEMMGESVAISGTMVVVGAPQKNNNQGTVFVYNCPNNVCTAVATLVSPSPADDDEFGFSVAIDGSTVVVGAPFKTVGGNVFQGSAYVFSCTTGGCGSAITLVQPSGAAYDDFGTAVAVSGNVVIVGADQRTVNSNIGQGSVYVFSCSGGSCGTPSILNCDDCSGGGENFGKALSISGSIVAIGAPFRTLGSNGQQGQGYIFDCTNPAACTQIAHVSANDGADSDNFATSVSIYGWNVAFGAPYANETFESQGAVYLFTCTPTSCTQKSKLTVSDGDYQDFYGFSVSLNTVRLMVGAPGKTVNGLAGRGASYFHDCSDLTGCTEVREFRISDYSSDADAVGFSVSTSSSNAVVGVPNRKSGSSSSVGAAYLYGLPLVTCAAVTEGNANWSRTTVTYNTYGTCLPGYYGSPSRFCQANSVFGAINNPCQLSVTSCPNVTYANFNWPIAVPGTTATGFCASGYSGSGTRQCLNWGWSTSVTGTCARLSCTTSTASNAVFPAAQSLVTVTGTCLSGYVGTPTRLCDGTGNWADVVNPCVNGSCPGGLYGTATFPPTGANIMANGVCQSGWSGSPTRKCNANGVWSTSVNNLCSRNTCTGKFEDNADFPGASSFQQVAGICRPPYHGAPRLICSADGIWGSITSPCTL